MANEDLNDGGLFIVSSLSIGLLGGWQLANALGCDRLTSWQALLDSLPAGFIALALWWYFGLSRKTSLLLFLLGAWPFWWKVLDKLSAGMPDPHTGFLRMSMQLDFAWYATPLSKGLAETLLLAALLIRSKNQLQ